MNSKEVRASIEKVIKEVAQTQKIKLPVLKDKHELVDDLGFTSLYVAALIANLEEELGIDPFEDENVMITDIRTIKDICQVYEQCLQSQ
jgi:acyl carrier protein